MLLTKCIYSSTHLHNIHNLQTSLTQKNDSSLNTQRGFTTLNLNLHVEKLLRNDMSEQGVNKSTLHNSLLIPSKV